MFIVGCKKYQLTDGGEIGLSYLKDTRAFVVSIV